MKSNSAVEAATARYIDSLGMANLQKAHDYTVVKEWMLLWTLVVAAVVTWLIVRSGLLDRMDTEEELAGVLGHEVGHVIHRHAAEQIAKGQLGAALAQAAGVAASDGSDGGQRAAMIAAMVNQVVQLRYGRQDESESDRYGIDAMADAGYDPQAMLSVMKILAQAGGGQRQPEWLSSHPLPETRLREIEDYLRQRSGGSPAVSERGPGAARPVPGG